MVKDVSAHTDKLDVLFNNAGAPQGSPRITLVTAEQMRKAFETNVMGPLFLTKTLIPLLGKKKGEKQSLIVNISSILGSISENVKQGGMYPYRSSKAALNAVTRSLSLDLRNKNVSAVSIHPGWVKTDLGGKNAPLTPEQSVSDVLSFVDNFDAGSMNGNFYNNLGEKMEW